MAGSTTRTLGPEDEVSHYKVVGPLGAGGMGEVSLAQDQKLGRKVAIKILPPDRVRSEERVRRRTAFEPAALHLHGAGQRGDARKPDPRV